MKLRLDKLLLQRGLAPSRERAQALIFAGRVLVNDQKVQKPGTAVTEDAALAVGDKVSIRVAQIGELSNVAETVS